MALSLKPEHLVRYKDLIQLIRKYGGSELLKAPTGDTLDDESSNLPDSEAGKPEELAHDLERLGPTYIKLGQLLSSRPDLLPDAYIEPLARLQDNIAPFPFEEVQQIVSDELGVSINKAFDTFEETPIAAASLGQVHRATLRDGREVAVKVQRPGIRRQIQKDMEALDQLAGFLDSHTSAGQQFGFRDLLTSFRRSLLRELDYEAEARNLQIFQDLLRDYFRIMVPAPIMDFTSTRVLTMEMVRGTKITRLSPLVRMEMDGADLAGDLARAYLDQILVHGIVHADPHPGNVYITSDRRIALLDLGMVMHLTPSMQENLIKLLLAIAERRSDEVATYSIGLSTPLDGFDETAFRRDVSDVVAAFQGSLGNMQVGRIVMDVARIAGTNRLRPAPELSMLGKTLFNLDAVIRMLDPEVNPNEIVREHATSILRQRLGQSFSTGTLLSSLLETGELVRTLPGRLNRMLDVFSTGEVYIRLRGLDDQQLMGNLQKIANRIALGLILAALIVGAAMLMQVKTRWTILGYPGLAMILFLSAAIFGFFLIVTITIDGSRQRKRQKGH